jgi:hypothetical protein
MEATAKLASDAREADELTPDSQMTEEEFDERIEAARKTRERRRRMRKDMAALASKLKKRICYRAGSSITNGAAW